MHWVFQHEHASIAQADWLGLAHALRPGSIDLLYADPPFNTGQTQHGRSGSYADSWATTGAWVEWLGQRLEASIPLLKPTGLLILHIDWRTSHHARLLLDDLLGADRFVNHLIWHYGLGGSSPRRFARKHDDLLLYCIDPDRYWFDPPRVPATSHRMKGQTKKATDVLSIPSINNLAHERTGYPTQKPLALLDLLIRACCPTGGSVLDPCCGSGTTPLAAIMASRRAIAGDISPDAVRMTLCRCEEWSEQALGPQDQNLSASG